METTTRLKELLHAIKKADKTKCQDKTMQVFTHTQLKFENLYLEVCTTDGNMLNLTRCCLEKPVEDSKKYLIDSTNLLTFLNNNYKLLDKHQKEHVILDISEKDNKLVFSISEQQFTVNIVDWQYPKYEQLINNYDIDTDFRNQMQDDTETFKISLNRKYLKSIIDNMTDDFITLELKHNLKAVNMYNTQNYNEFALLMPCQIRDVKKQELTIKG